MCEAIHHQVTIGGTHYHIKGGTIVKAAESAWREAGEPRGCIVVVDTSGRNAVSTFKPEVSTVVKWHCMEQREFRESEMCHVSQEGE